MVTLRTDAYLIPTTIQGGKTPFFNVSRKGWVMVIGDALKRIRTIYEYKASEMSGLLGISSGYLSEIENNKKHPPLELLQKYADIFEIKLSTLMLLSEDLDEEPKSRGQEIAKNLMMHWIEYVSKGGKMNGDNP